MADAKGWMCACIPEYAWLLAFLLHGLTSSFVVASGSSSGVIVFSLALRLSECHKFHAVHVLCDARSKLQGRSLKMARDTPAVVGMPVHSTASSADLKLLEQCRTVLQCLLYDVVHGCTLAAGAGQAAFVGACRTCSTCEYVFLSTSGIAHHGRSEVHRSRGLLGAPHANALSNTRPVHPVQASSSPVRDH